MGMGHKRTVHRKPKIIGRPLAILSLGKPGEIPEHDAKRQLSAEGLDDTAVGDVRTAQYRALQATLRPDEREYFQEVIEDPDSIRDKGAELPRSASAILTVAGVIGLDSNTLKDFADLFKISIEKLALRRALAAVGAITPEVLAEALGIGMSTLYAYADAMRPNRPGPEQLFRAAYLCRIHAEVLASTERTLLEVARNSEPVTKGRRVKRKVKRTDSDR